MTRSRTMAEAAGWYGICAVLGAYALASFSVIAVDSVWFQLLNVTGSGGLIWISAVKKVRQLVIFNIIWTSVAVVSLIRIIL